MAKKKEEFVAHIASRSEDFPQWYTDVVLKADMMDYSDVIVHIFTGQTREFYSLEKLWSDAEEVSLSDILEEEE